MRKKRILIVALSLLVASLALYYVSVINKNDAKMVLKVPSGFASLDDLSTASEGVLRYVFWESQISFLNSSNVTIYQTSVKNSEFIVKYGGYYYVKENKYKELLEIGENAEN